MLRKRITVFTILIPMVLLLIGNTTVAAPVFANPAARAALLIETDTGKILYQHNMDGMRPTDALTKVMTLLIAASACADGTADPSEPVEMTEDAWADITAQSTTRNIKPGEVMSLLDLMYCAFVGSANEACNMIAEHIAGSVEAFVRIMNERARTLGCEGTRYKNPHGQYDFGQYTTAYEQYLIYHEALKYPLFEEISGTQRYTVEATNKSESRRLTTTNSMLNPNSKYYYRNCASGLASAVFDNGVTGATFEGGYSIVAMAETDVLSLITVVLGSDTIMFEDESAEMRNLTESRRLFEWGFNNFSWRAILSINELVAKAPIMHGAGADFVNLRPESEIMELISNTILDEEFTRIITIYSEANGETLYAPVSAGDVLGEVTVSRGGEELGTVKLVANTSIELHRLQYIRMRIDEVLSSTAARIIIWILVVLVVGYAALVIRYNVIRSRRQRRNAEAKKKILEDLKSPEQQQGRQRTRQR